MSRIILLSVCFILSLYVNANVNNKTNAGWCAAYKRQAAFKTDIPLGTKRLNHDITGDGISDMAKRWGKYGTALIINCGNDASYSPIYSHTGIWVSRSSIGEWSPVKFQSHRGAGLEESTKGKDYSTWIDGEPHFFLC